MSKKKNNNKWLLTIIVLSFIISFIFSFISESILSKVNIIIGVIILIAIIIVGIIFDMIGVAVTSSNEEPLHAMSSKKKQGAKKAVLFKKNADKVSSFCNDVIGDICGIISGSIGVSLTSSISKALNADIFLTGLVITAIIASLTIGGKAYCKTIAIKNNHKIVYFAAKVISVFEKKKEKSN